jgi:hypothetical protein
MIRKLIPLVIAMVAISAFAQTQATPPAQDATKLRMALPEDARVEALANDLHAISRISSMPEARDGRQIVTTMLDQNIKALRIPREDGTYQYASLQREEASRVTVEKAVELVKSQEKLNEATATAPNAYRVEVVVPRKRNAFSSNNRVWVRNIIVDLTSFDGKTTRQEIAVNAWVNPGDSHGEALSAIGKSVKATAEFGVESGDKKAVANLALVQAKLVDDPNSAYYPAVRRLLQARELAGDEKAKAGQLRSVVDEALLMLPGELARRNAAQEKAAEERRAMAAAGTVKGAIAIGDATPDVVRELQDVSRMMTGTLQEQSDARTKLDALIKTLAPPVATNAPMTTAP